MHAIVLEIAQGFSSGHGPWPLIPMDPCGVMCPLLTAASVALAQALLPGQSSGVPVGEQSHCLCWGLMMHPTNEHLIGGC